MEFFIGWKHLALLPARIMTDLNLPDNAAIAGENSPSHQKS
jgi:hypothetical protein